LNVAAFLAELRRRDIQVWAEGAQLRCNAPAGVLAPELRDQLRHRKAAILQFLRSAEALSRQQRAIVPLQTRGDRVTVLAVPGHNGDVYCYRALARHLGDDQPFFGLQPPGIDGQAEPLASVEALAGYFAEQIRASGSHGPYVIAGYCAGGTIAYELARQLALEGTAVRFVALFASPYSTWYRFRPQLRFRLVQGWKRVRKHSRILASLPPAERRAYITQKLRQARAEASQAPSDPVLLRRARVGDTTLAAVRRYVPRPYDGRVCLFLPGGEWRPAGPLRRWRAVAPDAEEYCGPDGCTGDRMLLEPDVAALAELFRRCRDRNGGPAAP
jgi:thioesterase domain-containing protein